MSSGISYARVTFIGLLHVSAKYAVHESNHSFEADGYAAAQLKR